MVIVHCYVSSSKGIPLCLLVYQIKIHNFQRPMLVGLTPVVFGVQNPHFSEAVPLHTSSQFTSMYPPVIKAGT